MRFLIVPDSFKGTLTSEQAAQAIALGVRSALPQAEIDLFPLADGGEGSSRIAGLSCGGTRIDLTACGPEGSPVAAFYYSAGEQALIEVAAASGFSLSRNPKITAPTATSYGTGELIRHAIVAGHRKITLFLGGSATTDGGVGIARALGCEFYGSDGKRLAGSRTDEQISAIDHFDDAALEAMLEDAAVTAVADVKNPLCGSSGAAAVYGPQKGLGAEQIVLLDQALANLAQIAAKHYHTDFSVLPGAGAAGGIGFAVLSFLRGTIRPGSDFFLELIDFPARLAACDWVITGEGSIDSQTLQGKLVGEICKHAAAGDRRVLAVCGVSRLEASELPGCAHVIALPPGKGMTEPKAALSETVARAIAEGSSR